MSLLQKFSCLLYNEKNREAPMSRDIKNPLMISVDEKRCIMDR